MTRFEKLEYIIETCNENFIKECAFLEEMVRWMGENDFNEFFEHLCSTYSIKDPEELDEAMNEFTVEEDEMVFYA